MAAENKSFWTSLPGILTGIAAIIGALTPIYLHYQNADERQNATQDERPYSDGGQEDYAMQEGDDADFEVDPKPPLPFGTVTVFNADSEQSRSGFSFAEEALVAWHSGRADILVAQPSSDQVYFFIQYEEGQSGEYSNAEADRNAKGGIAELDAASLDDISECPRTSTAYQRHWVQPQIDGLYCVRTRDGRHYAKIHVIEISPDGISFDWVFQPENTTQF